jgi:hypothetical protein
MGSDPHPCLGGSEYRLPVSSLPGKAPAEKAYVGEITRMRNMVHSEIEPQHPTHQLSSSPNRQKRLYSQILLF